MDAACKAADVRGDTYEYLLSKIGDSLDSTVSSAHRAISSA